MESVKYEDIILNMLEKPVFCVKDKQIVTVNRAAKQLGIAVGEDLTALLGPDKKSYEALKEGCLLLTISLHGVTCNITIIKAMPADLFLIESQTEDAKLQAMALAAQQLRIPLSNVMTLADQMIHDIPEDECLDLHRRYGQLNKGLFQLLRLITNMADTQRYRDPDAYRMEYCEICSTLSEVMDKIKILLEGSGHRLYYKGLPTPIICIVCRDALERAVYNLISNAAKFGAKGTPIFVKASIKDGFLFFTVQNDGEGMETGMMGNVFSRYQRQPGIEDGRHGIGLGMSLIRSVAAAHGGTVLIKDLPEGGTRVTMTISITQKASQILSSPVLKPWDYAGGWDRVLIELSDTLNGDSYLD